jgi:hypothetical protein
VTLTHDDDGPSRPGGGSIHDGAEGGVHVTDEAQAARWRTLAVELPEVEVRKRIRHALASLGSREPAIGGLESRRGFVIKFRNGRHVRAAEVDLAAWDGGTKIHVALPAEYKSKDLATLTNWLQPVLGIFGAAEQ